MNENGWRPESPPQHAEFNFEKGTTEALHRIEELLASQEYVVVAVMGSSNNVGKSKVASEIIQQLTKKQISTSWGSSIDSLTQKPIFTDEPGTSGHVLILGAEQSTKFGKEEQDARVAKKGKTFDLPLSKIDLRIYVYRPDRPFTNEELKFADIIINNEHATDKRVKTQ